MVHVTVKEMFEAGAHFGHQTKKWNPKMKPYIYGARSGIHILDLSQTEELAQKALNFLEEVVSCGENVLFVGTKIQARETLEEEAKRASMPYMSRRWLGGTLTNFGTIKKSIERLIDLETRRANNDFAGFTKKELLSIDREIKKLLDAFGGIRHLRKPPGAMFVIDPGLERIAVHEANVLEIPVVAITDSNCDPDPINYVIPANDDAIRSIQLITAKVADACLLGLEKRELKLRGEEGRKEGDDKKGLNRKTREMGGVGQAYVSRVDSFEKGNQVESFSANVEVEDKVSYSEELEKLSQKKEEPGD